MIIYLKYCFTVLNLNLIFFYILDICKTSGECKCEPPGSREIESIDLSTSTSSEKLPTIIQSILNEKTVAKKILYEIINNDQITYGSIENIVKKVSTDIKFDDENILKILREIANILFPNLIKHNKLLSTALDTLNDVKVIFDTLNQEQKSNNELNIGNSTIEVLSQNSHDIVHQLLRSSLQKKKTSVIAKIIEIIEENKLLPKDIETVLDLSAEG